MDEVKAKDLESRLAGTRIEGWTIDRLVGFGKSAAVFRAGSAEGPVAIKIFDDELIERYGDATQFARIERERSLIGRHHPNLVGILGGGVDRLTNNHYIAMEFLDGPNLKDALTNVPATAVGSLISQLARAAMFLEDLGFCHRDIKPENIVITKGLNHLVLLDLGVIRPLAGSDLTDSDGVQAFIGTLQYSSPEFLLRTEEDSVDGWRALTFYQIGAVLHDLIMRRPLFAEYAQPYAKLVNAVQHETPQIQNSVVPFRLIDLARSCLLKNWKIRLELITWDRFREPDAAVDVESAKQRVTNRGALAQAQAEEQVAPIEEDKTRVQTLLVKEIVEWLSTSARSFRSDNPLLPPLRVRQNLPDAAGFAIEFPPAPEFGLRMGVTIVACVEALDGPARVIAVRLCGCAGPIDRDAVRRECQGTVFQGVYDASGLEKAFEDGIYTLIDLMQQQQDNLVANATTWIRLPEKAA
jgi:eukaryotic-like serine/threonine-protein kinase